MRKKLLLFLFSLCLLPVSLVYADEQPWALAQIEEILLNLSGDHAVKFESLEEVLAKTPPDRVSPEVIQKQTKNLREGETIWFSGHTVLPITIVLAGTLDEIHTINLYVAVVNAQPSKIDVMGDFLRGFFEKLLPEWPQASNWSVESPTQSWDVWAKTPRDENFDKEKYLNEFVVSAKHGIIELSTAGVPPDIVVFRISKRPECHLRNYPDDMFQRWVC